MEEEVIIIPVNKETLQPPGQPQQIYVGGSGNRGYLSKEVARESIEVNLIFEDDEEGGEEGQRQTDENQANPEGDLFTAMGIPNERYVYQTGTSTYIATG